MLPAALLLCTPLPAAVVDELVQAKTLRNTMCAWHRRARLVLYFLTVLARRAAAEFVTARRDDDMDTTPGDDDLSDDDESVVEVRRKSSLPVRVGLCGAEHRRAKRA